MNIDHFDPETHVYTRNGVRVWSCTQVLEGMGLVNHEGIPARVLENARTRGEAVDNAITDLEFGCHASGEELTGEYEARVNAWRRFRREVPLKIVRMQSWKIVEISVEGFSYLYGVTPDVEAILDGRPVVIDVKNTYSEEKSHRIQTAAQADTYFDPERVRRFCIYLKDDGTYKLKEHTDERDRHRWRMLLAAHEERRIYLEGK